MPNQSTPTYPKAVLFDLLTALLDSWSLWNRAAGSETAGRAWRAEYLRLTYGCGAYVPYEELVRQAALQVGLRESAARVLEAQWLQLAPWSGANEVLRKLAPHCRLAIVTNCSKRLGEQAAGLFDIDWDVIVTAESAGFYKPDPRPYQMALDRLKSTRETRHSLPVRATTCSARPRPACALTGITAWVWSSCQARRRPSSKHLRSTRCCLGCAVSTHRRERPRHDS
jgi:HAD superfamily hydrolase (TIGR01493 family)